MAASSRTPPTEMRRRLRKEVNYGCPICRSPFLTWHHFDPPWHQCHTHKEAGIIALCPTCHHQAEGGAYTKQCLLKLKTMHISAPPLGSLPWRVKSALISFGGNFFFAQSAAVFSIRVARQEVFSMRIGKNGWLSLNASIWDSQNALVLRLEENDIVSYLESIGDLECTAQARSLSAVSKQNDARFSLDFKRANPNQAIPNSSKLLPEIVAENVPELARLVDSDLKRRSAILIDADGLIPTIVMEIAVHGPGFRIDTTAKGIALDLTGLGYDRAVMTGKFFGEHALRLSFGNDKAGYSELLHLGSE